jgi:hypothetical protein
MADDHGDVRRNMTRRGLLTAGAAVTAVGVTEVIAASPASAATTPWNITGNSGIKTDGTNFLGTTTPAPIIFKTRTSTTTAVTERMRMTRDGMLGIGMTNPTSQLDITSTLSIAARATTKSTSSTSNGIAGVAGAGTGVAGTSTSLYGVTGKGGYAGVRGDAASYGGIFASSASGGIGVYGSGNGYGLYATGSTYGGFGSGTTYGLYGSGATGVNGSGTTTGVNGTTSNVNGNAVHGTGGQYGVHGEGGRTAGTRGDSGYVGAWGQGTTYGVYGLATDTANQTYGVFGQASNAAAFGVWSQGNAHVAGTLSKTAGSFKIDHPLDPERKWLQHSFVESPDMMNVYNGNVVLDGAGKAVVELPDYFDALNTDFRYQLTPIGGSAPVYIASKVSGNKFGIAGGTAGLEVSWQVTGVRQDAYAKAHRIKVETPKSKEDRGTRQFVPANSSAKRMSVGPPKADPQAVAPKAPAMKTPTPR